MTDAEAVSGVSAGKRSLTERTLGTPWLAKNVCAAPVKRKPRNVSGDAVTLVMLISTCLVSATNVTVGGGTALVPLLI